MSQQTSLLDQNHLPIITRKNFSELKENCIVLFDKPQGKTSHDVVGMFRRYTKIKRIGHAGTLDPLATGLLIVLVGRGATKFQSTFLHMDKEYECTASFGSTTDTYDAEGSILTQEPWEKVAEITKQKIEDILPTFTGEITQTVPAYSAVKIQGRKLYDQARKGTIDLEALPSRQVSIHNLKILSFEKDTSDQTLKCSFHVGCSSGTYIRSLIHDIGQVLEVGAHITQLRRTSIGEYSVNDAVDTSLLSK